MTITTRTSRQLLVAGDTDVASAAHAVGYDSPSQFSREYRQLFGPPGPGLTSSCVIGE